MRGGWIRPPSLFVMKIDESKYVVNKFRDDANSINFSDLHTNYSRKKYSRPC